MDSLDFIMMVEEGGFDPEDDSHIEALQEMIDSGLVWKLQGSWQRFARAMIKAEIVTEKVLANAGQ